jgi:predicted xylose isomerase-like sugar epimerase
MTDEELITTLRGRNGFGWTEDAADRIEELVEDNKSLAGAQESLVETLRKSGRKHIEAEAKLTKAVQALRDVVSTKGLTDPTEYGYDAIKRARAVLEELENYNG